MDAVELAIDDVQRPRARPPAVLDPRHAEIGPLRLWRHTLARDARRTKFDPRNLIAAERQIQVAVAVRIHGRAIEQLALLRVEQHLRFPVRHINREHLRHAHRDDFLHAVAIRVEGLDAPDRLGQRIRAPLPIHRLAFHRGRAARLRLRRHLRRSPEVRARKIHFEDHAFIADDVDFPALVGRKRGQALGRHADDAHRLEPPLLLRDSENIPRRVVAENIHPVKRRGRISAVNVSARHRVTIAPAIGRDRRRIACALSLA